MATGSELNLLDSHYQSIESHYQLEHWDHYAPLVTANGNSKVPFHRWFHMKEAFSEQLLESLLATLGLENLRHISVLDLFMGSGTSGVSLARLSTQGKIDSAKYVGMEVNPFLHFVSQCKINAILNPLPNFEEVAGRVGRRAFTHEDGFAEVPNLSTLSNQQYFPECNLKALLALQASIEVIVDTDLLILAKCLLNLALASTIEPASNLRRDGRALRFSPNRAYKSPIDFFLLKAGEMASDMRLASAPIQASALHLDSRIARDVIQDEFDLILFSPPYPNNIDYTEIYKMEGWFLRFYKSPKEVASQRRRTIRSHNSLRWEQEAVRWDNVSSSEIKDLVDPILAAVPDDRYRRGRREVIAGFVDDMLSSFLSAVANLKTGGRFVFVVGNSLHGRGDSAYVIASDLILARLAELVGLRIDTIAVARRPVRRKTSSPYLRESIVIATKL